MGGTTPGAVCPVLTKAREKWSWKLCNEGPLQCWRDQRISLIQKGWERQDPSARRRVRILPMYLEGGCREIRARLFSGPVTGSKAMDTNWNRGYIVRTSGNSWPFWRCSAPLQVAQRGCRISIHTHVKMMTGYGFGTWLYVMLGAGC